MLQKLDLYGFRHDALRWFSEYLNERRQKVVFDGNSSEWVEVTAGVPQGSILGPLLFNVFVNDMPSCLKFCKMMQYADDTTVYYSHSDVSCLKNALSVDIQILADWLKRNGLSVNTTKTKLMVLARKGCQDAADQLQLNIDGREIEKANYGKYLGVYVDRHLNWKQHIEEVRRKCLYNLIQLNKLRSTLPPKLKELLYNSLVLPNLDYCSVLWMDCCKKEEVKLDRIQKFGMRIILNCKWDHPTEDMRRRLGWVTLDHRRRDLRIKTIRKYRSGICPSYWQQVIKTNEELGCRSSRFKHDLYLPSPATNFLRNSFTYQGGKDWNQIPLESRIV